MRRWLVVVLLCGLVGSCAPSRASGSSAVASTASASHTIVLAPGQSGNVKGTPLTITVDAIVDDSRCPKGVECIWAGDVAVKLRIGAARAPSVEATLHLNVAPRDTMHGEHRVTLVDVVPYPVAGENIPPERYRATLRVETR